MTKIAPDDVPENLYNLRIRESDQLKNRIRTVRHGNSSEWSMHNYQKLKTWVKRSTDQKLRLRNLDAQNEKIETGAVVESRRWLSSIERRRSSLSVERNMSVFETGPMQFPTRESWSCKTDTKSRSPPLSHPHQDLEVRQRTFHTRWVRQSLSSSALSAALRISAW